MQEVFAFYGYKARAFPVSMAVYNDAMVKLADTGVEFPEDDAERHALFEKHGAWGVGIMGPDGLALFKRRARVVQPETLGGFNGHLVLQAEGMLVDGSIQQAQRSERNIVLPELLAFKAPAGFFAARVKGQTTRGMVGSNLVIYRRLDNQQYQNSPNWRQRHAGVPEVYERMLTLTSLELELARKRAQEPLGRAAGSEDRQTPVRTP